VSGFDPQVRQEVICSVGLVDCRCHEEKGIAIT
jgi:hypothetical protein